MTSGEAGGEGRGEAGGRGGKDVPRVVEARERGAEADCAGEERVVGDLDGVEEDGARRRHAQRELVRDLWRRQAFEALRVRRGGRARSDGRSVEDAGTAPCRARTRARGYPTCSAPR